MSPELVFFYGTLMTPFHRTARLRIDQHLSYRGSGTIEAALFDLGIYPAAVPVSGGKCTVSCTRCAIPPSCCARSTSSKVPSRTAREEPVHENAHERDVSMTSPKTPGRISTTLRSGERSVSSQATIWSI